MTNEEFLKGKERYNELLKELQGTEEERASKVLEIETRMKSLEEDEKVKEYIALMSEKEKLYIDRLSKHSIGERKANIIYEAFDDICKNTQDSNNIYVFMGYSKNDNSINIYRNLETFEFVRKNISERYKFEQENKVIYPNLLDKKHFFELLRENFLKYLSSYSQEESVEKILQLGKVGFKPRR